MTEPILPPAIFGAGLDLATLDAVIVLSLVISKHLPSAKDEICAGLRDRFEAHQRIVDEHGTAVNVNAAAMLRLIMLQIGCNSIPDHR